MHKDGKLIVILVQAEPGRGSIECPQPLDEQGGLAKAGRGAHQRDLATQPGVQALNKTDTRNHVITTAW